MKRILSIITIISMLLSMTVHAESNTSNVHELDLSGYDNFVRMLDNIDVKLPSLELDAELKGGDYLKSLNAFFGYSNLTTADGASKGAYDSEVSISYTLGWMTKAEKESFKAEESITLKQASKLMLNALGYNRKLRYTGNTDQDYFKESTAVGLCSGITSGWEKPLSYAQMLKLFYNAMDIRMIVLSDGDGGFAEGNSMLYEVHEIEHLKGIVTANSQSSIAGKACGINSIEIDGVVYDCFDESAHMLLGQYVSALLRDGAVLYVSASAKKNVITVIQNDDIENFSSLRKLTYLDENERSKDIDFEFPPTVIVNGTLKAISTVKELRDLIGSNGEIEAIDNDDDGKYEILKVTNYITYVADMINYSKGIIIDQHINKIIELGIDKYELTVVRDGKIVDFSALKVGDVIEISADKETVTGAGVREIDYANSEYITIIATSRSLGGIVNSINEENIFIDGIEFEVADYFNSAVQGGLMEDVYAGMSGAFFVNHLNKIVYVNTAVNVLDKYGFLVWGNYIEDNEKVNMRIFTADGTVEMLELADKVNVDGTSYDNNENMMSKIPQLFANTGTTADPVYKIKNQLVVYRLNTENQVKYIDTALVTGMSEDSDTALRMDIEFYSTTSTSAGKYNSYGPVYTNSSYGNVNIRGVGEKLFVVSGFANQNDHDNYQIIDPVGASGNFEVTTSSYFGTGDYFFKDNRCIKFYNVGDDNTTKYMVYYNPLLSDSTIPEVSAGSGAAFFVDSGMALNKDDEVTNYIKVFLPSENTEKTLICRNSEVLNIANIEVASASADDGGALKRGDIIRYALNANGEVAAIKRDIDFSKMQAQLKEGKENQTQPVNMTEPTCFAASGIESPTNYSTFVRWLGTRSASYFTLLSRKTNWYNNDIKLTMQQASKSPLYRGAFKSTSNILIYDVVEDEFKKGTISELFAANECGDDASVLYVRHTVSNPSFILAYNFK